MDCRKEKSMKTVRLLYPDYVSGGLDTYYFGANLLAHILPKNENQPLLKVEIAPPDGKEREVTDGIYENVGIIWIDAHPDVSMTKDQYPNAHAMVLGALMGHGEPALSELMKNEKFKADEILGCIMNTADVVGLTIAEYLPFDEHQLHKMFCGLSIFQD